MRDLELGKKGFLIYVLCLVAHVGWILGQEPSSALERQRAVEAGLLPGVVVAGRPIPTWGIWDRMERHRVPGVSIAVINDGVVEWAKGYGVKQAGGSDSVSVSTLFQAASISKPVTAAAILRLAERGILSLDEDVNEYLRSWLVQPNKYTAESPIMLRGLLGHNAGVTVPGFPGYVAGEEVPTAVDVLAGRGNSDPVRVVSVPGERYRYSGGGYTIAQVLLEDLTGEPFHSVMKAEVLDPVGMKESTFEQPLPERLAAAAAVGHGEDGAPIQGMWRTYPEQAAAGLWTTPTELARFLLDLRGAYLGRSDAALEPATVREMLSRGPGGRGLGFWIEGMGDTLAIGHGGGNKGYRSFIVLYPVTGDGVVVMTNAQGGSELRMEVVRAVSRVYGWPHFQPSVRSLTRIAFLVAGVILIALAVIVSTVLRVRGRRTRRA